MVTYPCHGRNKTGGQTLSGGLVANISIRLPGSLQEIEYLLNKKKFHLIERGLIILVNLNPCKESGGMTMSFTMCFSLGFTFKFELLVNIIDTKIKEALWRKPRTIDAQGKEVAVDAEEKKSESSMETQLNTYR